MKVNGLDSQNSQEEIVQTQNQMGIPGSYALAFMPQVHVLNSFEMVGLDSSNRTEKSQQISNSAVSLRINNLSIESYAALLL